MGKELNVLITGSSGSLGSYMCLEFLREGHFVVGMDLNEAQFSDCNHVRLYRFVRCDLADGAQVKSALDIVHADRGAFNLVVNNVGLIYSAPLLRFEGGKLQVHDFDAWNKVLSATLSASFYVTALCAQKMAATMRPGVIVNISSICAAGNLGQAAYSAAKAGINAMTVALSKELGPLRIRIAAISPGFFDTQSTHASLDQESLKNLRKSVPLRKLGQLTHIMSAIRFIVENDYFHGKVLELDGGLTI
ncbi:MAG: SDR family oxidoreductase [Desulfobacteraceae bacterium]|nr:MAG: SDR family oxidoreductase [Desulfobacteraceae bacterium]